MPLPMMSGGSEAIDAWVGADGQAAAMLQLAHTRMPKRAKNFAMTTTPKVARVFDCTPWAPYKHEEGGLHGRPRPTLVRFRYGFAGCGREGAAEMRGAISTRAGAEMASGARGATAGGACMAGGA